MATTAHTWTIEPDLRERIEKLAAAQVVSPEVVIRDAMELYLAQQECALKAERDLPLDARDEPFVTDEQMIADAQAASAEYDRTGLHVTWEEADAWLANLERGERVPPPECHV